MGVREKGLSGDGDATDTPVGGPALELVSGRTFGDGVTRPAGASLSREPRLPRSPVRSADPLARGGAVGGGGVRSPTLVLLTSCRSGESGISAVCGRDGTRERRPKVVRRLVLAGSRSSSPKGADDGAKEGAKE